MVEPEARPLAEARYRISCHDHDKDEFCARLAARLLKGCSTGLTWREVGLAIRKLFEGGWDHPSIFVERTDRGYLKRTNRVRARGANP